jgi:hypothetical protein
MEQRHPMDHNPYLRPAASTGEAAKGSIEKVDAAQNLVWQTRAAPPTDYENRLADTLEQIFAAGIDELAPLVARLNQLGSRSPEGAQWTEDTLQAYLRRFA